MALLQCSGLTKSYGNKKALEGVDLTIEPGRIVGLLGPNGSGKTTLIKIVNGLLRPDSGSVLIDGMKPGPKTKDIVSYLPERHMFVPTWMRSRDLVSWYRDFYRDFDAGMCERLLERLEVDPALRIREMNKGAQERLKLAAVMSRRAKLYLLDEPIGGVDPAARDLILNTVIASYDRQASVLISTHLIADVEPVLNDVVFLRGGRIVLSSPAEALRQAEGKTVDQLFREVFKC